MGSRDKEGCLMPADAMHMPGRGEKRRSRDDDDDDDAPCSVAHGVITLKRIGAFGDQLLSINSFVMVNYLAFNTSTSTEGRFMIFVKYISEARFHYVAMIIIYACILLCILPDQ
jgi:hypothetical protein